MLCIVHDYPISRHWIVAQAHGATTVPSADLIQVSRRPSHVRLVPKYSNESVRNREYSVRRLTYRVGWPASLVLLVELVSDTLGSRIPGSADSKLRSWC